MLPYIHKVSLCRKGAPLLCSDATAGSHCSVTCKWEHRKMQVTKWQEIHFQCSAVTCALLLHNLPGAYFELQVIHNKLFSSTQVNMISHGKLSSAYKYFEKRAKADILYQAGSKGFFKTV